MTRINGSFLLVCAVLPALLACPDPKPLPAPPVVATVKSFTSSLSTLKSGETTSLSWEVENATSVSIHTDRGEAVALPNGFQNIGSVDVPVSHTFCKHAHFLWAKGIISGCGPTTYCPDDPVTRDAMARFLTNGFNVKVYGP